MNRLTLGLAGAWLLAWTGIALAQGGPSGAMIPSYQGAPGYGGGMGSPYAQPAGYPMMQPVNTQQALYGGDSVGPGDAPSAMDPGSSGPYDGSCPENGGACGGCCPPFIAAGYAYGDFDLFYARRTNGFKNQPLFLDAGTTVVTTSGLAQDYEPGVKATVGYMCSQGFGIEGTYFGQFYFRNGRLSTDPNSLLSLPGDIGMNTFDFNVVPQLSAIYRSQIQNGELNYVLAYGSFQYLCGFRYLQWQDLLDITGNAGFESSDYVIHTNNNLYGGQLGARGQWEIGMFQFEACVKAGLYDNSSNEQQTIRDVGNTVMVTNGVDTRTDINATKNSVAFIGEVDVAAMVPMGSHWTGKLGYTAVWMTDLALAPNQLDFGIPATSGNFVNTKGSPILHGFTAGAEFRY